MIPGLTTWRLLGLCLLTLPLVAQPDQRGNDLEIDVQGSQVIANDGTQTIDGYVKIGYPGVFLMTAEHVEYDPNALTIAARGNIKMDFSTSGGVVEVTASEVFYHLGEETGYLLDVIANFGDNFFFRGERLEVHDRGTSFRILNGEATACNQVNNQWSLALREARVVREGYATLKGARFRIKNLSVLYIPFLIVPAMQKRRSGLLLPDSGSSDRNGSFFSLPVYWAPRQDMDFTFTPTFYKTAGWQFNTEARYRPNGQTAGQLFARFYQDRVIQRLRNGGNVPVEDGEPLKVERFRLRWEHDQPLFGGHFEVRLESGSDFKVDRDFLQDPRESRVRDYFGRLHYSKAFGRDRLHLKVNRVDRILNGGDQIIEVGGLPQLRYYQPRRKLGMGFYFRNQVYLDRFELADVGPNQINNDFWRLGLDTEIARGQGLGRWLRARYGLAYQGSTYDGLETNDRTKGGVFPFVETFGPRLQKSFKRGERRFSHVLDASIMMAYKSSAEEPFLEAVRLDELDLRVLDRLPGLQADWRLSSRVFVGSQSTLRPLFDWEIRQRVSLDQDEESARPIESRFRLINLGNFYANGLFEFQPDTGTLDTLAIYGSVNRGEWRGYGGYVRERQSAIRKVERESFIGISELWFPRWRSRFRIAVDYDVAKSDFKSQEFSYGYQGQCVGVNFKYVRSPFDSSNEKDRDFFQVTLDLRNLSELGSRF